MEKYAMIIESFSNSGKQSYGKQYIAIIKVEGDSSYFHNKSFPKVFNIIAISEGCIEFCSKFIDSVSKKLKYDQSFYIPEADPKLLEKEEFKIIFESLFNERQQKQEAHSSRQKEFHEKRLRVQAVLSEVEKGFRVWVRLDDNRKAVVDNKKLMIYQARIAPRKEAGEYACGLEDYEKRSMNPEKLFFYGVKERLFQKKIKQKSAQN